MDNPTKQILYRISTPNPYENERVRWTDDEMDARMAYNRGFIVQTHEVVEADMSTKQQLSTLLTTEWREK
jgi:hypothetical protein